MRVRSLMTSRSRSGQRLASALSVAVAACGLAAIAVAPAPSMAQTAAPAAKKDPVDARKDVISGVKAFEKGRMDEAIALLSKGLKSGGLPSADTAKALYYRGLANRRSGRPAQAISDLTSSVWLKEGLNEDERAKALENRSAAYAEAGLKDPGMGDMAAGGGAPKTASKSGPANPGASSTYSSSDSSGGGLSGVGNFFSGWFGGGSSAAQASTGSSSGESEPVTTAAAPATPANAPAPGASVSAWNSTTQKSAAKSASSGQWETASTQPARAAPAPTASVAETKPPKGRFEVQVAAVRSRDEAERLAHELTRKHASVLGSRVADVEETVFGNMGTFYRVSIGPFAKAADTSGLCKALKAGGYDCMVAKN